MLDHLLVQVLEEDQECQRFYLLFLLFFFLVNVCVWEPNGLSLGGNVGCVRNCPCREKFCWKDGKLGGGGGGGGSDGGGWKGEKVGDGVGWKGEKVGGGGKNGCWQGIVGGGGCGVGCCEKKRKWRRWWWWW